MANGALGPCFVTLFALKSLATGHCAMANNTRSSEPYGGKLVATSAAKSVGGAVDIAAMRNFAAYRLWCTLGFSSAVEVEQTHGAKASVKQRHVG